MFPLIYDTGVMYIVSYLGNYLKLVILLANFYSSTFIDSLRHMTSSNQSSPEILSNPNNPKSTMLQPFHLWLGFHMAHHSEKARKKRL